MRITPATLAVVALVVAGLAPAIVPIGHVFSAHMTRHMALVAVAAPLLAAAVAHGPLDPARAAPRLFAPMPASLVELIVVWAWHMPVLHDAARARASALALEQVTFLGAGLLLWVSAIGGPAGQRQARHAAGSVALLLTSMHMTLLGALFALSSRPLYEHLAHGVTPRAALSDQQLGGAIMLLVGGASYLAGGLWLVASALRGTPAAARRA